MGGTARLVGDLGQKAEMALVKVAVALERSHLRYCVDAGTLLGIYRENRLLPWDNDIDFYLAERNPYKLFWLRVRLLFMGFRTRIDYLQDSFGPLQSGLPRLIRVKSIQRYDGKYLRIDLFFKYLDGDSYHWVEGETPPIHKRVNRKFYDRFSTIGYKDRTYPIPSEIEAYLEARYGDWKTPRIEYDHKTDDLAIVEE